MGALIHRVVRVPFAGASVVTELGALAGAVLLLNALALFAVGVVQQDYALMGSAAAISGVAAILKVNSNAFPDARRAKAAADKRRVVTAR